MNDIALAMEFNARSKPQLDLAHWLRCQGVNGPVVLNVAGPMVEHDIIILKKGVFDFARPGATDVVRAIVHVALGNDAETPKDLVAWTRDRPDRIFCCLGGVQAIGVDQLFNPASYFAGRPLRIHNSALAWLAADCDGIVPVDFRSIRDYLDCISVELDCCRLAAASVAHGRALRDALAPLPARVRILVPHVAVAA
jgi:hypothetical protein